MVHNVLKINKCTQPRQRKGEATAEGVLYCPRETKCIRIATTSYQGCCSVPSSDSGMGWRPQRPQKSAVYFAYPVAVALLELVLGHHKIVVTVLAVQRPAPWFPVIAHRLQHVRKEVYQRATGRSSYKATAHEP